MLKNHNQGVPSHGRGHRFNPYSAHHFTGLFEPQVCSSLQYRAEQSKSRRGHGVDWVPPSFHTYKGGVFGACSAESFVYFAAKTDAIKIGFSKQPYLRQGQLKPQARGIWMIGVAEGDQAYESALHKRFDHLRLDLYGEREWFGVAPELVDFIDGLEAECRFIPWNVYTRQMRRQTRLPAPKSLQRKSVQLLHGYFPSLEYEGGHR